MIAALQSSVVEHLLREPLALHHSLLEEANLLTGPHLPILPVLGPKPKMIAEAYVAHPKQKQQTNQRGSTLLPVFPRSEVYQYQQYFRMRLAVLALLVLCLMAQDDTQPLSPQDEVALKEQEIRRQNNMSYTNVRAYTFVCGRFDDFVIKPSLTFETKIEMHVYWKKDNVYVSSEYLEGQEIRLIVYEDSQRVVLDRSFYTTTGLTFTAKQGSSYIVRFLAAGTVTKLVSMITSTPVQVSQDVASKVHIDNAQTKIQRMGNELKALLTISQRNFLMKQQIGQKILSSTQLYMLYEVFEVLAIIGVAIAQVILLTRLLKGSSIV